MKDLNTLKIKITYWIYGEFKGNIFEVIAGVIPGVVMSEDVDGSNDWAIQIESIEDKG